MDGKIINIGGVKEASDRLEEAKRGPNDTVKMKVFQKQIGLINETLGVMHKNIGIEIKNDVMLQNRLRELTSMVMVQEMVSSAIIQILTEKLGITEEMIKEAIKKQQTETPKENNESNQPVNP